MLAYPVLAASGRGEITMLETSEILVNRLTAHLIGLLLSNLENLRV